MRAVMMSRTLATSSGLIDLARAGHDLVLEANAGRHRAGRLRTGRRIHGRQRVGRMCHRSGHRGQRHREHDDDLEPAPRLTRPRNAAIRSSSSVVLSPDASIGPDAAVLSHERVGVSAGPIVRRRNTPAPEPTLSRGVMYLPHGVSSASPATDAVRIRPMPFPPDFLWGTATAAYQVEGAVERGRPRRVHLGPLQPHAGERSPNGETGDVACDQYHRYAEDVDLMADLGLRGIPLQHRLATLFPDGHGELNQTRPRLLQPAGGQAAGARHHAHGHALPLGPAAGAPGQPGRLGQPRHGRPLRRLRRRRASRVSATACRTGSRSTSRGSRPSSAIWTDATRPVCVT